MKFSTKEDIDAPIEAVFEAVSQFAIFERAAIRRGADVQRVDTLAEPGVGMAWDAHFTLRGRKRQLAIRVVEFDAPTRIAAQSTSAGMIGRFEIDLIGLSRTRTRMAIALDVQPQTLSARLFVQSLRLAKGTLTKRFKLRVAEYAKDLEDRYASSA